MGYEVWLRASGLAAPPGAMIGVSMDSPSGSANGANIDSPTASTIGMLNGRGQEGSPAAPDPTMVGNGKKQSKWGNVKLPGEERDSTATFNSNIQVDARLSNPRVLGSRKQTLYGKD